MRVLAVVAMAASFWAITPEALFAHPGGTDAQGCHTNRKTGERHCHNAKRAAPPPGPASGVDGDLYFATCDEARAAGYQNIRRGEPGYRPPLDRDNDGLACEPYRGR